MLKKVVVVLATAACTAALAAVGGTAHASEGTSMPQFVSSTPGVCSPKAARQGKCEVGTPIYRVTMLVPVCTTVDVALSKDEGRPRVTVTWESDDSCVRISSEPRLMRFILRAK